MRILPRTGRIGVFLFLCIWICSLGQPLSAADARPKKTKTGDNEAQPARVRIWKEAFAADRTLFVTIKPTGKKGSSPSSFEVGDGYQFLQYQNLPAGSATVDVFDDPGKKTSLFSRTIQLNADGYFSLFIRETEGQLAVELIDDTPQPDTTTTAEITVRNLIPDLQSLNVKIGEDLDVNLAAPGALFFLRGLPRTEKRIVYSGTTKAGTLISWSNDVDLQHFRKMTIVIYADGLDRVRPRVLIDGGVGDANLPAEVAEPTEAPAR